MLGLDDETEGKGLFLLLISQQVNFLKQDGSALCILLHFDAHQKISMQTFSYIRSGQQVAPF